MSDNLKEIHKQELQEVKQKVLEAISNQVNDETLKQVEKLFDYAKKEEAQNKQLINPYENIQQIKDLLRRSKKIFEHYKATDDFSLFITACDQIWKAVPLLLEIYSGAKILNLRSPILVSKRANELGNSCYYLYENAFIVHSLANYAITDDISLLETRYQVLIQDFYTLFTPLRNENLIQKLVESSEEATHEN